MTVYAPGTLETDQKKQNMALQQQAKAVSALQDAASSYVAGPASATDNALARYDGTTGKLVQGSDITLGDSDGKLTRTAGISISGTNTNDSAATGYVGEYQSSTSGSVALTTSTITNLTSRSLTAGDWDVTGTITFDTSSATATNIFYRTGISTSSTTNNLGAGSTTDVAGPNPTTTLSVSNINVPCATVRLSIASTTTVYLNALAVFSSGTMTASGFLRVRRVR